MLLKTWRNNIRRASSSCIIKDDLPCQISEKPDADLELAANSCTNENSSFSQLTGDVSSYVAEGYNGQFYLTENRSIIGWIASDIENCLSIESLRVRVGDSDSVLYSVKSATSFDIEVEKSFDNLLFFTVDTAEFFESGSNNGPLTAELYNTVTTDPRSEFSGNKLLTSKVRPLNGDVFNSNPLMISDSTVSIINWEINHDERNGLRLDRFSSEEPNALPHRKFSSDQDNTQPVCNEMGNRNGSRPIPAYTRITLTDSSSSHSPILLSCPLTPVVKLESEELEVAMRVRSDRPTWLICRLKRNGITVSTVETLANYQWNDVHLTLPGSNVTPLFRTVRYHFELELKHAGRGFIDFAACAIGLSPRLGQLLSSDSLNNANAALGALSKAGNSTKSNFIRNGDFSAWSNGVSFQTFKPRQQTADGWRFECRDNQTEQVDLQLAIVDEVSPRKKHSPISYGLRVKTREFTGPMRVVTVLDHDLLNASSADLTLDLSVTKGCSPIQFLRRIYILGRRMGKEEILHIIARKPRVHDCAKLVYSIDEATLIRLRTTIGVYSSLLFVIEYETNSDVVISSAVLCQKDESSPAKIKGNETLSHSELCFEDAGILTQSMTLNGLEKWSGGLVKVDHPGGKQNSPASGTLNEFCKPVLPSWNRPSRNYPTVDIVVPIYNALSALKNCLISIVRETTVPYTLICVDDASALETREFLADFSEGFPHVRIVANSENIGYTRNVNRGIENSTADWVCVLNSDCIVTTNWLERLLDVAISSSEVGIVGPLSNAASYQSIPRIKNHDKQWSFNPLPATMQPNDMANLVWEHSLSAHPRAGVANGFCQLIRRDMLDSIGWLDEAAFPRGFGEENDLCARAVKSGWDIRIADDTYVYHVKSQSFGHTERKRLSKDGSSALKEKHPDVDWKLITHELENEHSLVELRKRLISAGI